MATIRRAGFGSVFEVENSKVGIGTTGVLVDTVQVLGNVRSSNANVINIAKLPTYEGFLDNKTRLQSNEVDLDNIVGYADNEPYYGPSHIHIRADGSEVEMVGAAHTTTKHAVLNDESDLKSDFIGGDIVIDGEFTVSPGASYCSGVDQLTVTSNFTAPTGNTEDRIHCHTAGSMRFNEDLGTLEFYTGEQWRTVNSFKDTGNRGRMLVMGGGLYPVSGSYIQSIQINIQNSSVIFGDLTRSNRITSAVANEIRGVCMGGSDPETDTMDYVTMASEGNAVDFGNLTSSKFGGGGAGSSTRGLMCGGYDSPANTNDIDYFEIMTLGDALDFGDLTRARRYPSSVASPTRVVTTGGTQDSYSSTNFGNRMTDIFTISSKGNAVDFAPLSDDAQQMCAFANATRGIFPLTADPVTNQTSIDQLNLASGGNATYHGDLGRKTSAQPAGGCNQVRGLVASGFDTPGTSATNHIDMIEIQTSGSAVDFGELHLTICLGHGCSDSHGGLGGF